MFSKKEGTGTAINHYGSTTQIFITDFRVVDPDSTGSVDSGSDSNLDFAKQTMTHNKETRTFMF